MLLVAAAMVLLAPARAARASPAIAMLLPPTLLRFLAALLPRLRHGAKETVAKKGGLSTPLTAA